MIGFKVGRRINRTELYLAHFLGLEEAARFMELRARKRAPSAAKAFPAAARANAGIFFVRGKRGKLHGLSVHQVYDKFDRLIGARSRLYRRCRFRGGGLAGLSGALRAPDSGRTGRRVIASARTSSSLPSYSQPPTRHQIGLSECRRPRRCGDG